MAGNPGPAGPIDSFCSVPGVSRGRERGECRHGNTARVGSGVVVSLEDMVSFEGGFDVGGGVDSSSAVVEEVFVGGGDGVADDCVVRWRKVLLVAVRRWGWILVRLVKY